MSLTSYHALVSILYPIMQLGHLMTKHVVPDRIAGMIIFEYEKDLDLSAKQLAAHFQDPSVRQIQGNTIDFEFLLDSDGRKTGEATVISVLCDFDPITVKFDDVLTLLKRPRSATLH